MTYWKQIYENGRTVPSEHGAYLKVVIDDNIEFWLQFMKAGIIARKPSLADVEFHFSSGNANPLRFDCWIEPKENLSGGAYVWNSASEGVSFPMVINMPDADLHTDLKNGDIINVQLACFSEGINLFDTKEEFEKAQPEWSDEFFIPSGTFNPDGTKKKSTANAIFGGYILSAEKRVNSHTAKEYYHFTVRCQGIIFDVLADAAFIIKEPKIGGILSGSFWLSGKIIN